MKVLYRLCLLPGAQSLQVARRLAIAFHLYHSIRRKTGKLCLDVLRAEADAARRWVDLNAPSKASHRKLD